MTLNEAEQLLDIFLKPLIQPLGFGQAKRLRYASKSCDATAILSFGGRLDPRGYYAFTLGIGLHFEAISKWTDDNPTEKQATVGTPIHFLREDKSFTEWKFSNAADLEGLRGEILSNLKSHAIPYIERYSNLPDLRKAVESPNPKDWIDLGLNQDSRVNMLAAIQLAEGDRTSAIKTLDDAMAERKTALPKRRFEIEKLRNRLVEMG